MGPAVWLLLPTYNEAENLERVVDAALAALDTAVPGDHRILIVDDASPDGTGEIADGLAARHAAVEVLHRPSKDGLGGAYVAGFERALADGAELLLEMDADLSHDPADLPRLLAAAEDADLVLGSRYVPGGGVSDWGLLRRGVSRAGCLYARRVLRLPVQDPTGGFKVIRRSVLEAIDIETLRAQGYAFQVEVTFRAVRLGFRVREVPIVFRSRERGKSKMSPNIALEAVWLIPRLRRIERRRVDASAPAAASARTPV